MISRSLAFLTVLLLLFTNQTAQLQAQATVPAALTPNLASLYQFTNTSDGGAPLTQLIADRSGALYGTTANGGFLNAGTVYQLNPPPSPGAPWTYKLLHSFGASGDGAFPQSKLIMDAGGNLFGTTYQGGAANLGTVFMLVRSSLSGGTWTEKILHSFQGGSNDGGNPYGGLVFDKQGNLYGTTQQGGPYLCTERRISCGTIYQLTRAGNGTWIETVLYKFQGRADGAFPDTGLAIDMAGALYGTTTFSGGTNPRYGGIVFQLTPQGSTWAFTTIKDFLGIGEPSFEGDLVLDSKGAVYGTSWSGGPADMGFIYRLTPPAGGGIWTYDSLWNFIGTDGSMPQGGVIWGPKGRLLGTTYSGGNLTNCNGIGCGVIFSIEPNSGAKNVVYRFTGGMDGAQPQGALLQNKNNTAWYGTTSSGGNFGAGTVFQVTAR